MAGDTAQRGSASYWLQFAAGGCASLLVYEDLVPPTGGRALLDGRCGGTFKNCQTMDPTEDCGYWVGGTPYRRVLPNTAFKVAGQTVTFDFDPNALPAGAAPRQFLDGFQAGKALTNLGAMSSVRGQSSTSEDDSFYVFVDQASSDKPLALGGSTPKRSRR